jgi:hypothetical protein
VETRTRLPNRHGEQTLAARPCQTRRPARRSSRTGAPAIRSVRKAERPEGRQYRATRRSRKATGHGRGTGEVRTADRQGPVGSARPSANRMKGGDAERRTRSMPGQALKGKPRGRARMKQAGEIATGARRRGRLERRGRNRTRRRQLREWWLAAIGLRRGGTNLERAGDAGGRRRGRPGDTPKRGERPRKARGPVIGFAPGGRRPRGGRTTGWERRTHEAIVRRGAFEGTANRTGGGQNAATR